MEYVLKDERTRRLSQDQRAELLLGALALGAAILVYAMLLFIIVKAWPSYSHNKLDWFIGGGHVDQQLQAMFDAGSQATATPYTFHAWQLIWSSILIIGTSVVLSFFISLFAAVFIVEFAPAPMRRVLTPVIRLLASVPSVVYGLIAVLTIVPFLANHLITDGQKESVAFIVNLNGFGLITAIVVLTVMISPIMIAVFADGLRTVPALWKEGSLALGVNRWRTTWKITVRGARPAIVAGTVLASARALGEAIMLAMVSGSVAFAPNPADGLVFFFEPSRPLGPTIITNVENLSFPAIKATLFAIGGVLLVSTMILSLIGYLVKQPMKKYGIRA